MRVVIIDKEDSCRVLVIQEERDTEKDKAKAQKIAKLLESLAIKN